MIKKYKKRPVVIDAIKWPGYPTEEINNFVGESLKSEQREGIAAVGYYISTIEGNMWLSKHDYIIKGVNGEFYPCKPHIFEKTYEEVL